MLGRLAGNPPRKGSAEIDELSETLNRLGRYLGIATEDRFRNVNGVYMKLMNFRRFDPLFTEAGKSLRLRIHVPGFDAVCRMVQADMGVGMMPDRAFDVIGRGMGLRSIRLRDTWARRQLKLAVRQARLLSRTGRLVFEHLREAEGAGEAAAVC